MPKRRVSRFGSFPFRPLFHPLPKSMTVILHLVSLFLWKTPDDSHAQTYQTPLYQAVSGID